MYISSEQIYQTLLPQTHRIARPFSRSLILIPFCSVSSSSPVTCILFLCRRRKPSSSVVASSSLATTFCGCLVLNAGCAPPHTPLFAIVVCPSIVVCSPPFCAPLARSRHMLSAPSPSHPLVLVVLEPNVPPPRRALATLTAAMVATSW